MKPNEIIAGLGICCCFHCNCNGHRCVAALCHHCTTTVAAITRNLPMSLGCHSSVTRMSLACHSDVTRMSLHVTSICDMARALGETGSLWTQGCSRKRKDTEYRSEVSKLWHGRAKRCPQDHGCDHISWHISRWLLKNRSSYRKAWLLRVATGCGLHGFHRRNSTWLLKRFQRPESAYLLTPSLACAGSKGGWHYQQDTAMPSAMRHWPGASAAGFCGRPVVPSSYPGIWFRFQRHPRQREKSARLLTTLQP